MDGRSDVYGLGVLLYELLAGDLLRWLSGEPITAQPANRFGTSTATRAA